MPENERGAQNGERGTGSPEGESAAVIPSAPRSASRASRLWLVVKWLLFLVVLAFVARHGHALWTQVEGRELHLHGGWLALAVIVYILSWMPSVWYWRWLMQRLGDSVPWPPVIRAYYGGHLGKYVPGKAATLVIRAAMLRPTGVHTAHAAYTVTFEALTYMAAGGVSAVMLLPWLFELVPSIQVPGFLATGQGMRIFLPFAVLAAAVVVLSVSSRLLGRMASRMARGAVLAPEDTSRLDGPVWLSGLLAFLGAWWMQGLVLGLTISGVTGQSPHWTAWPIWTESVTIANVGGFIAVFAPGGLGVREGLLMELLRTQTDPHTAVVVTVFSRAVSLAGDILAATGLYYGIRVKSG